MEISVISERENPLLSRKELWIRIKTEKMPTIKEVRDRLSAEYEGTVIVDTIKPETGTTDVIAYVKIYKDEKTMLRVERKSKLIKNGVISDGEGSSEQEGEQVQG